MAKWYESPSSQQANVVGSFNEETYWNEITDRIVPILIRHCEEVKRNNPKNTYALHVIEANAWPADYDVIMHSNAIGNGEPQYTRSGPTVGCSNPSDPTRQGTKLANLINIELHRVWGLTTIRPIVRYTFSEITDTHMPAVYSECGYHDNPSDQAFLLSHKQEIAIAFCIAQLKMVGKTYDQKELIRPMYRIEIEAKWRTLAYAKQMLARVQALGVTAKITETME
jgi:hypothetical protein